MEDVDKLTNSTEVKPSEPTGSVNPADSTSKLSLNELSPDSTSEIENPSKTERLDSYVISSKVNGDCSVECSVPSPSSVSPNNNNNNNNTSTYKITPERNSSFEESSHKENTDESARCDSQKKIGLPSEAEIDPDETEDRDQAKNLNYSSQQEHGCSESQVDERTQEPESLHYYKREHISNVNEVTSTLEEKDPFQASDSRGASLKPEIKPPPAKAKKSSLDPSTNKNNDTFKQPPRYDLKSSTSKTKSESATSELSSRQNDGPNKVSDKTGKNNKRKIEDKHLNSCEVELNDVEKFPIQYKGFKKKTNISENKEKRLNLKWNPFNPACKPNGKSNKCIPSRLPVGDEIDCSNLQQSEYAQYLGLQPILKFRCSNCGSSAFQSMVALNTHQLECTKSGKGKLDKAPPSLVNTISEPKSTNIKLTRKVFLCSACGTYYEHWNLFLHMREVHRRYICLYCLGMFSIAEKLSEHLIQKHKIAHQNFCNLEDFQKHSYQTFFLLCLTCDKVFSEMDDFYGHLCAVNKKNVDNVDSSSKCEATSNQECSVTPAGEVCSNNTNNKTSTKRTREASKKNAVTSKSSQIKKEETANVNVTQKADDSGIVDLKEEVKQCEIASNKSMETENTGSVENIPSESNACILNETDTKSSSSEQDIKLQESQVISENLTCLDKTKPVRKNKLLAKKSALKRKKLKEKEEESDVSSAKIKKISEEEPAKEVISKPLDENGPLTALSSESEKTKDDTEEMEVPTQSLTQEPNADIAQENKEEAMEVPEEEKSQDDKEKLPENPKEELPSNSISATTVETKNKLQANLLKFKLPGLESDGESDDSQKLSLVVDETANSDPEPKVSAKSGGNSSTDSEVPEMPPSEQSVKVSENSNKSTENNNHIPTEGGMPDITLASEDVAVMALTLDDKIENIPIQTVLKECVRTSCMSCNYCRHAVKIAVNGKQLALHILSEHRYMPIKNETPDDVINKLKTSLATLQSMFFNTETYDSCDPSIHVPYDQDSSFDCFQCNYVTSSHRDLFAHKRKSHTKSLLLCIMCKSNFYSYSELLCHLCPGTYNAEIQFHNVDINFRCCFCRLDTIPSAFRLMVHLRKTHHTCDICLENGVDQQKLSTHMWKHKLNHLCYRCGIAYASKPDITKHLFWKHGHESVLCKKCLQKKWPHVYHFCIPPTSFICEECNTSFSKAVALKVHKRVHGNDFPYTCMECNKKFVSKKLLQRHEERHIALKNNVEQKQSEINQEEEQKEEIINVSDVINEKKESSSAADLSDSKEVEPKDKSHKKHKKDKEKKDKQVVDVYDLPPLNLSSDSDSTEEDNNTIDNNSLTTDNKGKTSVKEEEKKENIITLERKEPLDENICLKENEDTTNNSEIKNIIDNPNSSVPAPEEVLKHEPNCPGEEDNNIKEDVENRIPTSTIQSEEPHALLTPKSEAKVEQENENLEKDSSNNDYTDNKEVEDIWKNFYSTNPQNSNLPYPLCAINSEIALGIIMGDHDYCSPRIPPPTFSDREEIPSTSGLPGPLINDQLEEVAEPPQEKVNDISETKDVTGTSSPVSSPKKKPKSPKKKNSKGENENNSSTSSDSSSESSSSTCTCGTNCSCSSSSSNSSSSSSSDSESSVGEEGTKQERKRKKRERRSKTKSDHEPELPKEQILPPIEKTEPLEPVDPPIRESELETDETTTDEEFYDQQPQRIANQLLAEKRNQLMLLASAANVNNGNASPSPMVEVLQPEIVTPSTKQKVRTKRKRKVAAKGKANSHLYTPQYTKETEPIPKPVPQYLSNPLPTTESKLSPFVVQTQVLTETTGSGSETEKSRSSKRRRIPNKFYGYSSGDEEEKPNPSPKWRKQETVSQTRVQQQPPHQPTPRIQLTVPKQVIRKPYKLQKSVTKAQPSSSDSTDSGSEMETQRSAQAPAVNQDTSTSAAGAQKNDKDVYCYCRCPYDEVSEMIACDDENCEIEWFHFECVGILVPPRGQWFCPGCRKARGLPT